MILSHLLGQAQLPDLSSGTLIAYAKLSLNKAGKAEFKLAIIGLQGGAGPANVDLNMRGALLPAWRLTYVHAISYRANFNKTVPPKKMPSKMATRRNKTTEKVGESGLLTQTHM